jgi:hypothetical protein
VQILAPYPISNGNRLDLRVFSTAADSANMQKQRAALQICHCVLDRQLFGALLGGIFLLHWVQPHEFQQTPKSFPQSRVRFRLSHVIMDSIVQKTSMQNPLYEVIHSQCVLGRKIFNKTWNFCKTQEVEAEFIVPATFRGQRAFSSSLQNRSRISSVGSSMLDNTAYAAVS